MRMPAQMETSMDGQTDLGHRLCPEQGPPTRCAPLERSRFAHVRRYIPDSNEDEIKI